MVSDVLLLDKSIRFCAVCNKLGYIITSKYRRGLKPLMTVEETQRYALIATIRHSSRQAWEDKIGKVQYALTRYEKLVRATVPLRGDMLLLISFDESATNVDDILREKIMHAAENYI